jgi:hypothetical protein
MKVSAVAFLVGSLMSAATFQTIPGSGMEVIPGFSSEFNQTLTEYLGPDPLRILEPIAPYVVIVRNNSSSDVAVVTVRWATTNPVAPGAFISHQFIGAPLPAHGLVLMTLNRLEPDTSAGRRRQTAGRRR